MGLGDIVYNTLWGEAEVPENRTLAFLLSNFSYILFGILLILKRTGDQFDEDRVTRAWIILLVGFVSTIFHANQVVHGHEDTRTDIFHKLDITIAVLSFIFAVIIRGVHNIPSQVYILLIVSAPFYLYNGRYYWLSHSIWHFISALILYNILDY
jgi:hypothetical protein